MQVDRRARLGRPLLARSDAFGRAVTTLHGLRRSAVKFHKLLRVVNVATEGTLDRLKVKRDARPT